MKKAIAMFTLAMMLEGTGSFIGGVMNAVTSGPLAATDQIVSHDGAQLISNSYEVISD